MQWAPADGLPIMCPGFAMRSTSVSRGASARALEFCPIVHHMNCVPTQCLVPHLKVSERERERERAKESEGEGLTRRTMSSPHVAQTLADPPRRPTRRGSHRTVTAAVDPRPESPPAQREASWRRCRRLSRRAAGAHRLLPLSARSRPRGTPCGSCLRRGSGRSVGRRRWCKAR
jgi:hypothetical protein